MASQILSNSSYVYTNGDNGYVPVSPLDNILVKDKFDDFKLKFYNVLSGMELNDITSIHNFYKEITKLAGENKYVTTDHLIYSIEIDNVIFLYISLDNSVRSNMNSNSLAHVRLENLLNVVKKIMKPDFNYVVFFSESCRSSFIGEIGERKNEISWLTMRNTIENITNLNFVTEKKNNEDYEGLSFGISVWCNNNAMKNNVISNYYSADLLNEGFGSVSVGIKISSDKIIWGIHFPVDFKNKMEDNYGSITMKNLIKTMDKYRGSVCAFGDFNLIPGMICNSIKNVLDNNKNYHFVLDNVNTFFGAYYDTIPKNSFETEPVQLIDLNNFHKYKMLEYICYEKEDEIKKMFKQFIDTDYKNTFDEFIGTNYKNFINVFDTISKNNLTFDNIKFVKKSVVKEINLYPEQFEYFGADGNLVCGQEMMELEYMSYSKNPMYKIILSVLVDVQGLVHEYELYEL